MFIWLCFKLTLLKVSYHMKSYLYLKNGLETSRIESSIGLLKDQTLKVKHTFGAWLVFPVLLVFLTGEAAVQWRYFCGNRSKKIPEFFIVMASVNTCHSFCKPSAVPTTQSACHGGRQIHQEECAACWAHRWCVLPGDRLWRRSRGRHSALRAVFRAGKPFS